MGEPIFRGVFIRLSLSRLPDDREPFFPEPGKTSLSSMFEAVGAYAAGNMSEEDVKEFENKACPTCGSCSGMYTANSMNCLTEVLGMGLKGNGTIPAVYSERIKLAKHAGMKVMEMYEKNIRPRDIMTKEAFMNALTMDTLMLSLAMSI